MTPMQSLQSPLGAARARVASVSSSPLRSIQLSPSTSTASYLSHRQQPGASPLSSVGGFRGFDSRYCASPTRYYAQIGKAALSPFVPSSIAGVQSRSPPWPASSSARLQPQVSPPKGRSQRAASNDENDHTSIIADAGSTGGSVDREASPSAVKLAVENEALRSELASVRGELALAKGYGLSNKELQKRLAEASEHIKNLEVRLEEGDAERAQRAGAIHGEACARAEAAEAALAEKAAECAALSSRADEAASACEKMAAELKTLKGKVVIAPQGSADDGEKGTKRRASIERQLRESIEVSSVYRKELDNITLVLRRYEEENRELKAALKLMEERRGRQNHEEEREEEEESRLSHEKVRDERDALRQELQTMSETMKDLTLVVKEKEKDIEKLTRNLSSSSEADTRVDMQQHDAMRRRVEEMEAEYEKIGLDFMKKNKKIEALSHELGESTRACAAAKESISSLRGELEEARTEHATRIASATSETESLRVRLEEASQAQRMLEEFEQLAAQCQMDAAEANEKAMAEAMEAERLRMKMKALEEELLKKSGEVAVLRDSLATNRMPMSTN